MAITLIKPADTVSVEQGFHDHNTNMDTIAAEVLLADGTKALSADWDIGDGRMIQTDKIRARDGDGLALYEDGGSGLFIKDGGNIGHGTTNPSYSFHVYGDVNSDKSGYVVENVNTGVSATSYISAKDGAISFNMYATSANYTAITGWQGKAVMYAGGAANALLLNSAKSDGEIQFAVGGLDANANRIVTMTSVGMGIGTTTPNIIGFTGPRALTVLASSAGNYQGLLELGSDIDGASLRPGSIAFINNTGLAGKKGCGLISMLSNASGTANDRGYRMQFWTKPDGSTYLERLRIASDGIVGINTTTAAAQLSINGGCNIGADTDPGDNNLYVVGDCSALTFTDRTPYFEGDALKEIGKIKGKDGMIDHDTLPAGSKSVIALKKPITKDVEKLAKGESKTFKEIIGYEDAQEIGRNLSGMVSMLTVAIQQLTARIEKIEEKLNE